MISKVKIHKIPITAADGLFDRGVEVDGTFNQINDDDIIAYKMALYIEYLESENERLKKGESSG